MKTICCFFVFCLITVCIAGTAFAQDSADIVRPERHYLIDELVAMGMKDYPGSTFVSGTHHKKSGAYVTTFTTTDSIDAVMKFYTENMKNLKNYGFQAAEKASDKLRNAGIDPALENSLVYSKSNKAVQLLVRPHGSQKDVNKITIKLFRNL